MPFLFPLLLTGLVAARTYPSMFEECHFRDFRSLDTCRSTYYSNTLRLCEDAPLPERGFISIPEIVAGHLITEGQDEWHNKRDASLTEAFRQAARGTGTWTHFLQEIAGPNLGSFASVMLGIWVIAALICTPLFFIAMCLRQKERKPAPLAIVAGLSLATALTGMVGIYLSTRATASTQNALEGVSCIAPRSLYSVLFLDVETSHGASAFIGVRSLEKAMDELSVDLTESRQYFNAMDTKGLLKFATHGLYAPFLWTDGLLNVGLYKAWSVDESISLGHTIVGLKALELAGVITEDATQDPYAEVFTAIDVMGTPNWDQTGVQKAFNSFEGYLGDARTIINKILEKVSIAVNEHAHQFRWESAITDGLYTVALVPIAGLLIGVALFVFYMIRGDNSSRDRNVGAFRLGATGAMCWAYAFWGVLMLLLTAGVLLAVRAAQAGCDYLEEDIITRGEIPGGPLAKTEQALVDECLVPTGGGNILNSLTNLTLTDYFHNFIDDSWAPPVSARIHLTQDQLDLAQSDNLGLIVPQMNLALPLLMVAPAKLYWNSPSLLTSRTVDCTKEPTVCQALTELLGASQLPPVATFPWAGHSANIVYGAADATEALTELVKTAGCGLMPICAANDVNCSSLYHISAKSVGYFSEQLLTSLNNNWHVISAQAGAVYPPTAQLFHCFDTASEEIKLQWANGVRLTVLRDLVTSRLRRDPDNWLHNDQTQLSDGRFGFFDPCPYNQTCPVTMAFTRTDNHHLELVKPIVLKDLARGNLELTYSALEVNALVNMTLDVAANANPIAILGNFFEGVANSFDCRSIGDLAKALHQSVCPGFFNSMDVLARRWFIVAVAHILAFAMCFIYWFQRRRTSRETSRQLAPEESITIP